MITAEKTIGWLTECDETGRFLVVCRELVDDLTRVLKELAGDGSILEVCAGSGQLSAHLKRAGLRLHAIDINAPDGSMVLPISARVALRRFQPAVVLGAFVPSDAGVDEAVLKCQSVMHYVVLNARTGGVMGSSALWRATDWKAEPLALISRWMLTRHDVWLGMHRPANGGEGHGWRMAIDVSECDSEHADSFIQHGEAWRFTRIP